MTVTFCGHRKVHDPAGVREWLRNCVEGLILEGAQWFYLGGYGEFDRLAASVVAGLKTKYPSLTSTLVLAYLDRPVNTDLYDGTLYPPIESTPPRYAITARNQWMVEHSDVLVAYILQDSGGAAGTRQYARRKKKTDHRLWGGRI